MEVHQKIQDQNKELEEKRQKEKGHFKEDIQSILDSPIPITRTMDRPVLQALEHAIPSACQGKC